MKDSIRSRLTSLKERYEELAALLAEPQVIADQDSFKRFSKEYSDLEPIIKGFTEFQTAESDLEEATQMLQDADIELRKMAQEEIPELKAALETLHAQLKVLLLPKDPDDHCNVYLEIRAGTGGDEAAIFSGDLYKMYSRYAESLGWSVEVVSCNEGDHGGYKEVITRVSGRDVFSRLKFESGAHRVQRVPETESQGRIHTSACTVAVMPEAEDSSDIDIDKSDLRVDTYRASGAGGQHVNRTDSAIRITHLPSGLVVECQEERSQHKNRAKAMALLATKLKDAAVQKQQAEQAAHRKSLVGSGDRSERIRTYNYPQGRVTDHRINLTLYKLDEIIAGNLDPVINPLMIEAQAQLLAEIGEE